MTHPKTEVKLDEENVFQHDSLFFLIPQWMIMSYILDCMDTNIFSKSAISPCRCNVNMQGRFMVIKYSHYHVYYVMV